MLDKQMKDRVSGAEYSSVIECFPSTHKVQGSIPSTGEKKLKDREGSSLRKSQGTGER